MRLSLASLVLALAPLAACTANPEPELDLGGLDNLDLETLESLESRQATDKCAKGVHVIATRGDSDENPPYGSLETLVRNITGKIPQSNSVPNKYNTDALLPMAAVVSGSLKLQRMVRQYVASCPMSKIVLLGYSKGAVMTMNALCGFDQTPLIQFPPLDNKYAKNVLSVVVYGDESRSQGQSYNRGSCQGRGVNGRQKTECGAFRPKIRSFCDSPDPLCCIGGTKLRAHFKYPQRYDSRATKYVVGLFKKLRRKTGKGRN